MWQKFIEFLQSLFSKISAPPIPKDEPPRKSPSEVGQKLLWCPFAKKAQKMKVQGTYPKGYPEGAIIHWTSGSSAESSMSWGRDQGYMFWMIDKDGEIYQPNALNEWGYHAGASSWPGLGSSVSSRLVGIEIDCAGKLEKRSDGSFKSWFGRIVPHEKVREVQKRDNIVSGAYEMFTKEQETSLVLLLKWLHSNNPSVFRLDFILGHDEVSPGRKVDPGGSLSMSMPELREKISAT